MILTAVAAAAIAISAQAQTEMTLAGGTSYSLTSASAGSGTGAVSYQWYRNGAAISGATSASYTLPGYLAHGYRVEFKRGAKTSSCPDYTFSNAYILTFYVQVGSVKWATTNLTGSNAWAERPDMYTSHYQWNKTTAMNPTGGTVSMPSADNSTTWTVNPCPSGWRIPTQAEYAALNAVGSTWAAANAKGNAVVGRFYGANHANCNLTSSMLNCIFLPAGGYRNRETATILNQGANGYYHSSTQYSNTSGYYLYLNSSSTNPSANSAGKADAFTIRCVQ